jgi:hypothetical protein
MPSPRALSLRPFYPFAFFLCCTPFAALENMLVPLACVSRPFLSLNHNPCINLLHGLGGDCLGQERLRPAPGLGVR